MEIAIPNIIRFLQPETEWEYLRSMYVWNEAREYYITLYSPYMLDFYHALKFSEPNIASFVMTQFSSVKAKLQLNNS